ncbi:coatomer complex subunit beta [Theileria orientalis]|uniref:Coatomer subunit beta' n=1 Tax=Theileria orientalis TaxID=68886 RepID=A0A976QT42_THEOR|nr:coatomer complex subunit beta [Theileria orientalis]
MSLQMGFTKKLELHTEKVKSVDMHPSEPWVASAMYNGTLTIYNYNTQSLVKKIDVSDAPLRTCKFVPRKHWIATGGDKNCISVYNYNSLEKVIVVEAHKDYVRYLDLHPSMPYVLSCSDDMTVVIWDIDRNWEKVATFEGHSHYVMMAKWNPKDPNIFATCSLDKTISFWRVSLESDKSQSSNKPYFTLTGHEKGVNCIDFSSNSSSPYIISGSDDFTIRVWDYQTKLCLQVLKKHFKPVSCVLFHPRLPLILSTGEDGDFNVWHSNLYKIKRSVNYGSGPLWHVATNNSDTALASDSGTYVLELAGGKPLASMHSNKLLMVKSSDILTCNLTTLMGTSNLDTSQPLNLSLRSIGSSEFFPQDVSYHPNGRFICLCGDSEYIIYTSQGMKSKTFGRASQFVWSFEGDYATYDGFEVSVYSEFTLKEKLEGVNVKKIHGGRLLGISTETDISFYTWSPCELVKQFSVAVDEVYWHPTDCTVALTSHIATFIFVHNLDGLNSTRSCSRYMNNKELQEYQQEDDLFRLEYELVDRVTSAVWVNDTFLYVTSGSHLNMYLYPHVETLVYLEKPLHLLGYLEETQLVYLFDDGVYAYTLPHNYLTFHSKLYNYYTLGLKEKMKKRPESEFEMMDEGTSELISGGKEEVKNSLSNLDQKMKDRASRFLQMFEMYELGLFCTSNPDLKFDFHLKLGDVNECLKLLLSETKVGEEGGINGLTSGDFKLRVDKMLKEKVDVNLVLNLDEGLKRKWKRLGDYCLKISEVKLAKLAYKYANELQSLLVLNSLTGDAEGVKYVAETALASKLHNVAFTSYYMLNQVDKCIQILHSVNKHAEATFMARTYKPQMLKSSFNKWNENLKNKNVKLMEPLFDNTETPETQDRNGFPEASQYINYKNAFFSEFGKQGGETSKSNNNHDVIDL